MKGSPPQTLAGNNYNKFAGLPVPAMKAYNIACEIAMLYEIVNAQRNTKRELCEILKAQLDTKRDAKPPESDSEPEHFEYWTSIWRTSTSMTRATPASPWEAPPSTLATPTPSTKY